MIAPLILVIVFGLIAGSFFNVLVYRLPRMLFREWRIQAEEFLREHPTPEPLPSPYNLFVPRSACPNCHQMIKAWHNIPIISFLLLRGRCAYCQHAIGWRYPLVELLTVSLAVIASFHFSWGKELYFVFAFIALLLPASFIDFEYQLLPDELTLGLLWIGLLANSIYTFCDPTSAILGAVSGYLILYLLGVGYQFFTGREGIGYGDYKLLAALGAWVGWQFLPFVLFTASLVGSIIGLGSMLIMGYDRYKPIPFGPYLSLAGFITLVWGDVILHSYFHLFSNLHVLS